MIIYDMSATIKGAATELGTERIRKLLMQYAVPAIIAMTASSLYNMVDSIFIGHGVGPLAISGLALTFPLMNLAAAFGSLVGVGAATLVSMRLGQRDYQTAQNILGNVVVLNLIIGLAFGFITLLLLFFLLSAGGLIFLFWPAGTAAVLAGLLTLLWLRRMAAQKFGGMSGDLSGWFLQVCELAMLAAFILTGKAVGL